MFIKTKIYKTILLSMVYLFLSHLAFGQNENKSQNWEWQNFPAEKSTKKLDDFISKYRELSYDWEEEEYIAFLNKVFKAAKALEDKKALSYSSINLGGIYVQLDSFAQALYFLNYVIELDDGDRFMAYAYNDLGNLYSNVNNYSMALESYFKSVKYNKIVGDGEETYPLGNISDIYMALDDIDNAIKYTVACIPFSMSLDFPDNAYNLSNDYSRLIDFYNQKNDLDSCNHYIDLFLEVIQPIDTFKYSNIQEAIYFGHITIAEFYFEHQLLEKGYQQLLIAKSNKYHQDESLTALTEGKYFFLKKDYAQVERIIQNFTPIHFLKEQFF